MIFRKKESIQPESEIQVLVAGDQHLQYVDQINDTIEKASLERGTGIARRSHEYIASKISEGKAIIALNGDKFAGFCYIETWNDAKNLYISIEDNGIGINKEDLKLKYYLLIAAIILFILAIVIEILNALLKTKIKEK